jgi:hypothetical protein
MAVIKMEQKARSRNALLRVSIPASLMDEIKKTKKLCRENGSYFDIKPDVIAAVEKSVEDAKKFVSDEKKI